MTVDPSTNMNIHPPELQKKMEEELSLITWQSEAKIEDEDHADLHISVNEVLFKIFHFSIRKIFIKSINYDIDKDTGTLLLSFTLQPWFIPLCLIVPTCLGIPYFMKWDLHQRFDEYLEVAGLTNMIIDFDWVKPDSMLYRSYCLSDKKQLLDFTASDSNIRTHKQWKRREAAWEPVELEFIFDEDVKEPAYTYHLSDVKLEAESNMFDPKTVKRKVKL